MENSKIFEALTDISLYADVIENLLSIEYSFSPDSTIEKQSILDGAYYLSKSLNEKVTKLMDEVERKENNT